MRNRLMFLILALLFTTIGCRNRSLPSDNEIAESIVQLPKMYTVECVVDKLILIDENRSWTIGDRKMLIPVEAVLKAGIDFGKIPKEQVIVNKKNRSIKIYLPDADIHIESTSINYKEIKTYSGIFRSQFTRKEQEQYFKQGRDSIVLAIPNLGIISTARENALQLLYNLLEEIGFDKANIEIVYKDDLKYTMADVENSIKANIKWE